MAGDLEGMVRAWTAAYTEEVAEFAPPDQVIRYRLPKGRLPGTKLKKIQVLIVCFGCNLVEMFTFIGRT